MRIFKTAEARHRSAGNPANAIIKSQRNGSLKPADKNNIFPEKISSCNLLSLKVLLTISICVTFWTLLHSPSAYHNLHSHSRSRFLNSDIVWEKNEPDFRYASDLDVNWAQISEALEEIDKKERSLQVGLLNFNTTEVEHWKQLLPKAEFSAIHLDHVWSNVTWQTLYPEWIDELEESEIPTCPNFPKPQILKGYSYDLVAVKLPCNSLANCSRDVARLHLQLAAANVAVNFARGPYPVHVLFVTHHFPIPNLFTSKNLIAKKENVWLYKPDQRLLKEKLQLPVGSCELAVPLRVKERPHSDTPRKEAYATILHSANMYVCGAITAAQSIRLSGSNRDLVILVDETVSEHHLGGLKAAGWKIKTIQRIRNPKAEQDAYNEWNYSKFRLWQLTEYEKIIFIDADLIILRNIDFLFTMPEITATGNNATLFNSGVMVIEPSNYTFQLLMDHINEIESYNGGDQGYLNEIFTWWHRIPKHMNFLKHFWVGDEKEIKEMKTRLFGADPPVLYVLHYLGLKPWLCFRDYDCNWNVDILQEFASDVAHATWWKVHDSMSEDLQHFCLLRSKQKAALEWDRMQAEKANFSDGHWRRKISDPRLSICFEEFCFWESMLWHWGDPNWSDGDPNLLGSVNKTSATTPQLPST